MESENPSDKLRFSANSESKSRSHEVVDFLFAALFLTSFGALIFGNLLLLKPGVFRDTALMWMPFFGLFLIFYATSRWTGNLPLGLCIVLGSVVLLVKLGSWGAIVLFYAAVLVSAWYTICNMRVARTKWLPVCAMAVVGVLACFSVVLAYNGFDNLNALRAGVVHKDPLYHSAISAMIKNYGVVSTGLHGLVETPYYVMSHTIVALASLCSGLGVFQVYGVYSIVFLIPLLIFSLAVCVVFLGGEETWGLAVAWALGCVLLVLPQCYLWLWGVNPQTMISESSVLGMAIFVFCLVVILKAHLSLKDIALLCVLAAFLAFTKLPTAIIFAGLCLARWLFVGRLTNLKDFMATLGVVAVVGFFFMDSGKPATEQDRLGFFHYIRVVCGHGGFLNALALQWAETGSVRLGTLYGAAKVIGAFWLFHFLFSWAALGIFVWKKGLASLWSDPLAVALWTSIAGGSLFLIFFVDEHGAAYYFSHVAFFIAIPALGYFLAKLGVWKNGWLPGFLCLLFAMLAICWHIEGALIKNSRCSVVNRQTHESQLVDALLDLRGKTPKNAVLNAPPEVWKLGPIKFPGEIWESPKLKGPTWHSAGPFFYPAITERPWTGVIPPSRLEDPREMRFQSGRYDGHGYALYDIDTENGGVKGAAKLQKDMELINWNPTWLLYPKKFQ